MLDIAELEIDDGNEKEMAAHGVSAREILQLLENPIRVFRNKKDRAAPYLMIGVTRGGRVLTAPIVETPVAGRWRPITAWDATPHQKARYGQK